MAVVAIHSAILNALSLHYADFEHDDVSVLGHVGLEVTPPDTDLWLEAALIRNEPLQPFMAHSATVYERGIFQVGVCDRLGLGEVPSSEVADAVAAHFKAGTKLTASGITVHIDRRPTVGAAVKYDTKIKTPVSIPYWVEAPGEVTT
jgi:hypothetical protein